MANAKEEFLRTTKSYRVKWTKIGVDRVVGNTPIPRV